MEGKGLLLVLLAAMAVCTKASPHGTPADHHWQTLKAVSHSNLDFTNALFKVMSKQEQGNFFFSPMSIHVIMALTSLGARGDTAHEMTQGLHLPSNQQNIKDGFKQLITSFQSNYGVTTKMANKIFVDSRFTPVPEFVEVAKKDFLSGNEAVDFHTKHDEARVHINSWVMNQTENKIKDLLPRNSVDSDTVMVLVNALYFKGPWHTKFEARDTSTKPFHVSTTVTKQVPMMHMHAVRGEFAYTDSDTLNAQILEIPYQGNKVSMMIILPKEKNGLHDVETRLAGMTFSNLTSHQVSHPNVHLYLPKFKLEYSTDLKDTLKKMGIVKVFTPDAELSGLIDTQAPIQVSKVVHKAFIEVDEKGTEAAAATAVNVRLTSAGPGRPPAEEITFNADHPFILMLVNKEPKLGSSETQRTIMFMGRYSEPK